VLVGALVRRAEAEGGFGAILARGDATAGAIVVILLERGGDPRLYERILQPDGRYAWQSSAGTEASEVAEWVKRRRRVDPDLWVVELDLHRRDTFAEQMNTFG
jgi:hypothetical protein